jgi:plasmid stability protein
LQLAQLLIRNLKPETVEKIKQRATKHNRSLQGEAKLILEEAASYNIDEARKLSGKIRASLANKKFTDSSELAREDRNR